MSMTTTPPAAISTTEACEAANITVRQLDWWIRHDAIPATDKMKDTGSGKRRRIPLWYIPRLRLMGDIQRSLFGGSQGGGLDCHHLRLLFDHYEDGVLQFDSFSITWTPTA